MGDTPVEQESFIADFRDPKVEDKSVRAKSEVIRATSREEAEAKAKARAEKLGLEVMQIIGPGTSPYKH